MKFSIKDFFSKCEQCKDNLVNEFITITSELLDHSKAADISCVSKVFEKVREKNQHLHYESMFSFG